MQSQPVSASTEYPERLAIAELEYEQLNKRHGQFATLRLVLAALALAVFYFWNTGAMPLWWLLIPVLAFVVLVVLHRQVTAQRQLAQRRCAYYENCIARLNDEWSGVGPTGASYLDLDHEYAADLDLFGVGSLFQLLNAGRTQLGKNRLADWLRHAADRTTIVERQHAVERLRNEIDLREQLALLIDKADEKQSRDEFDSNQLLNWSAQPPQSIDGAARVIAIVISVSTVVVGVGSVLLGWGWSPGLLMLAVALLFLLYFKSKIKATMAHMDEVGKGLHTLSQVLEVIQQQAFDDAYLDRLVDQVQFDGIPPSQQVARLAKLIARLNNSTRNQFFIPVSIFLCLPLHLVHAIESWRATVGQAIPDWLESVADFEASVSLSRFAFERPNYPFPAIATGSLELSAVDLGHPLLKDSECVRNDITLGDEHQMLMVSGSNMSGKSTLLRTIGINSVLAQMGAPVCARAMTLSTFQIGTAMRVSDSLQEGQSLFFAVLNRLKRVVDLTQSQTEAESVGVLFLLDEILQGTNSHDRRIGAEAVIRSLLKKNALGLVTTHDLSLTEIAATLPKVKNVHFADQIQDGKMTFDYKLRQGTVEKSNAIELMRLVGLEV